MQLGGEGNSFKLLNSKQLPVRSVRQTGVAVPVQESTRPALGLTQVHTVTWQQSEVGNLQILTACPEVQCGQTVVSWVRACPMCPARFTFLDLSSCSGLFQWVSSLLGQLKRSPRTNFP